MSKLVIPGVIAQSGNGGGGGDIPDNVYTQDNLIAGKNISITEVQQPIIDEDTIALYHFNQNVKDEISGNSLDLTNWNYGYVEGKFGDGFQGRSSSSSSKTVALSSAYSSSTQNLTIDWWTRPLNTTTPYYTFVTFVIGSSRYGIEFNNQRQVIRISSYIASSSSDVELPFPTSITWGDWFHVAYVNDASNSKVYLFVNGSKVYESAITNNRSIIPSLIGASLSSNNVGMVDEIRVSNIARWTDDFTPFSLPYQETGGDPVYQINNTQPSPDLSAYLQNTATGTNSLTILGTPTSHTNVINIGKANNTSWSDETISIGNSVTNYGHHSVVIGNSASGTGESVTVGCSAKSNQSFSVTIGSYATSGTESSTKIAIGAYAFADAQKSIAIGCGTSRAASAQANANEAIQIGTGTNSTAKTLQVYEWPLLDGNTGKIFSERLPSGNNVEVTDTIPTPSSSNVGQVKLYSGTTTSDFTNGYLYQCKLESTTSETVTFDSDKVATTPEIFWLIVKLALPETYSNVTNGYITYNESASLVTFTFKDANGNVLGEFPADVGEISSIGITFNNLVDGDVINFTCSSSIVEFYKWEPVIVQESSGIKLYNATSWSENTTLFPNRSLPLPNVDDLTNAGLYRVKFNCSMPNIELNLDYLCQVSAINASGTIIGHFQTLQVFYPSLNDDRGISVTLYRSKQTGSTWSDWKSSLVTSVSNNSTDVEYVSAKLFYDTCGNIEALINAL